MAGHIVGMALIRYYDHLIDIMKTNPELHKTAKGVFKQVAWMAAGTVAGAAVAGRFGAMVGGTAGSLIGYSRSVDYQSLIGVMEDLSEEDKKEIARKVQELVGGISIEALTRYIGSQAQRSALLNLLRSAVGEMSKRRLNHLNCFIVFFVFLIATIFLFCDYASCTVFPPLVAPSLINAPLSHSSNT